MTTIPRRQNLLCVLLATPRYLPFIGGVENHVYQVARRLVRVGVAITVLTTDVSGQLPKVEEAEGVHVRRVRAWPAQRDYYWAPEIYQVITRGQWDVVHVQSYHTLVAPLAMLAAIRARIPYAVTFHGGGHSSRLRHALRGAQQVFLRPLLARAAKLIALAKFEAELFQKRLRLPAERFVVIPNGADLPQAMPAQCTTRTGTLIASVGRLERYKGHQRIVAALPHIIAQQPDAHLWIAGTGPYESELQRLASRLGVAERVEFCAIPLAQREEMTQALTQAALVVLLSEYETHPIAILEALALGRPALVADTSGLSELAAQGWARAIPLKSTPEQVAAAALTQLRQPLIPNGVRLPSWDDCASELLAVYNAVARKNGRK